MPNISFDSLILRGIPGGREQNFQVYLNFLENNGTPEPNPPGFQPKGLVIGWSLNGDSRNKFNKLLAQMD